jgi:hypothetical protein
MASSVMPRRVRIRNRDQVHGLAFCRCYGAQLSRDAPQQSSGLFSMTVRTMIYCPIVATIPEHTQVWHLLNLKGKCLKASSVMPESLPCCWRHNFQVLSQDSNRCQFHGGAICSAPEAQLWSPVAPWRYCRRSGGQLCSCCLLTARLS